jgi:uncharacterized protein YbaR (Trm112 family)
MPDRPRNQLLAAREVLARRVMISPELLEILRCPMDPTRTARLQEEGGALVCQRCRLTFPIKEGIPCLLVEEASLPPGCDSPAALPCQQQQAAAPQEARP